MDLLEHQGKQLFAAAGIPVLRSCLALTAEAARDAAGDIGLPVVVKAQARTGGRGKAGGSGCAPRRARQPPRPTRFCA